MSPELSAEIIATINGDTRADESEECKWYLTVYSTISEINGMAENDIPIPEYLETTIKKSDEGKDILMSWPSKDTLICQQDTAERTIEYFESKGWHAYKIYEIDYNKIKGDLC